MALPQILYCMVLLSAILRIVFVGFCIIIISCQGWCKAPWALYIWKGSIQRTFLHMGTSSERAETTILFIHIAIYLYCKPMRFCHIMSQSFALCNDVVDTHKQAATSCIKWASEKGVSKERERERALSNSISYEDEKVPGIIKTIQMFSAGSSLPLLPHNIFSCSVWSKHQH